MFKPLEAYIITLYGITRNIDGPKILIYKLKEIISQYDFVFN